MQALSDMNTNLQASRDEGQRQLQEALQHQSQQFSVQLQTERQNFDSELASLRSQVAASNKHPVPSSAAPASADSRSASDVELI